MATTAPKLEPDHHEPAKHPPTRLELVGAAGGVGIAAIGLGFLVSGRKA